MYTSFSSSITIGNSSFENNEAGRSGGVVYTSSSSSITVDDSSFGNNEAGSDGGVMYASSSSNTTVGNSSFDSNEAGGDGGAVYTFSGSNIRVEYSSFDNNGAGSDGGVMYTSSSSIITLVNSSFDNNEAGSDGGVVYCGDCDSNINMGNSTFHSNTAGYSGGVLYYYCTRHNNIVNIFISLCTFFYNSASEGGVAHLINANVADTGSMYYSNMADNGGTIVLTVGYVSVRTSTFMKNTATISGGVLYSSSHDFPQIVDLESCCFINNSANSGGAIATFLTAAVTVTDSSFVNNSAVRGGAVYLLIGNNFTANSCNFFRNFALNDGGLIYSEYQNRLSFTNSEANFNRADNNGGAVCLLSQSELNITGDNSFVGNEARIGGVAYARECTTIVHSLTFLIVNNTAMESGGAVYLFKANLSLSSGNHSFVGNNAMTSHGGAIYLGEAQLTLSGGNIQLIRNKAVDGGAMFITESELIIESDSQTKVDANSAFNHGGGLYLTKSKVKIRGESSNITGNRADNRGGGIHASNSSIIIQGAVHVISNEAENGGGISLENNANLRGATAGHDHFANFVKNRASGYGGALYVNDKSNPDMCTANIQNATSSTECFSNSVYITMSENFAGVSGSNLFGGLLDRCTVYNEASMEYEKNRSGIMSFLNSSNINESQHLLNTVSSNPVRLCFCRDSQPDCNYQPETIKVNRGKVFFIELIAYDQISQAVIASIQCSFNSSVGGLGEGERIQDIGNHCTVLKYNIFTSNSYEGLIFSAVEDPCNNISKINIMIEITCSCPIGFQVSNNDGTTCDCDCAQVLQSYQKTECNPATESIIRRENFWISYINYTWSNSSGYVIYPHCPFDYCYTPDKQVSINLNLHNGSDAQCNSNRMGTLCGACKPDLSVSLGSSKCVPCPRYWPGYLLIIAIVFIVLGIGLVAFLLLLNLTVAIGTFNAIIFYANIVAANQSALFPSGVSAASVFISWLNFDIGIDVCFFDGLDTYVKTWLQLAFPTYIIILVVLIVQLSYHFDAFGRYVGKKDPVGTLATLILLSYAKLLQTIITAFSSATLVYPDGSKKILWLPDATIEFITGKPAAIFIVALFILLAGLVYTLLLFSWQWFLYCPRKRVKWIRNQKLSSFMEVYHIPYIPKHRYWTGLLLLARVCIYLISAFNPAGDPRVTLLTTTFVMVSLTIYIIIFRVRMYKNRYINIMEILTYFNIITLSIFTRYTIENDTNQTTVTNISVGITFVQLIAVIVYHAYKHTNPKIFAAIKGSSVCIKIEKMSIQKKQKEVNDKTVTVPPDEDIHRFHELLDIIDYPVNTNDYNIPHVDTNPPEPTKSVVELPKPVQAPSTSPSHDVIEEDPEIKPNNNLPQKPTCIPQIDNYSDKKPAKQETKEKAHLDNIDQNSQEVASGLKEGVGARYITLKAEIHDY